MTSPVNNLRSQSDRFFDLMTKPTDNGHSIKEQVTRIEKLPDK